MEPSCHDHCTQLNTQGPGFLLVKSSSWKASDWTLHPTWIVLTPPGPDQYSSWVICIARTIGVCIGPHLYSNLVTNALANSLIYCINILIHVTNAFSDGGQNEYRIEALQWKMHLCMNIFSFSCLQPVRIHLEAYCHLVCVTRGEVLPGGAGQCHGENDRQVTGLGVILVLGSGVDQALPVRTHTLLYNHIALVSIY